MNTPGQYSLQEILTFVIHNTGCAANEVTSKCDIINDLGCYGDDFDELIDSYAKVFNVDISNYRWYFHSAEEGHTNSIGRIFFKTPYERVTHIPVTPDLLLSCANAGKWLISYPEHRLPQRRYDIIINQLVAVLFVAFLIYKCSKK